MPAISSKVSPEPALSPLADTAAATRKPPPLLFFRLAAMAIVAPWLVRAGLPRLQRWIEPRRPRRVLDPVEASRVEAETARWVDAIIARGHPLVRPGCLTRGVTLYYALRREGDDVALCFGIGSDAGEVAGHCWLDKDGGPVLERVDPLSKFTEVTRLSSEGVTH